MADEGIEAAAALVMPPNPRAPQRRKIRDLRRGVLSGSAIMLVSSVFVGVMNLVYNFAVAHKLGAGQFGHASAIYTVLMLLSSVTLSFQLLCSKFVARSDSESERIAIYNLLHRRSWLGGLGVGVVLLGGSSAISHYLNLPSPLLVRVLAIGTVFYVPLGNATRVHAGHVRFCASGGEFQFGSSGQAGRRRGADVRGIFRGRRCRRNLGVVDRGVLCRHSAQTSFRSKCSRPLCARAWRKAFRR